MSFEAEPQKPVNPDQLDTTAVEEIDVEKSYASGDVAAKLRRLADALDAGKTFHIQIAGQRISVPPYATIEFEYEQNSEGEELEIELKWNNG